MKLNINIRCSECNEELETRLENLEGHYQLKMFIDPCDSCLKKSRESALLEIPNSIEVVLNNSEKRDVKFV